MTKERSLINSISDKQDSSAKLDCIRRLEQYLQFDGVEKLGAANIVVKNSMCYVCDSYDKNNPCTADKVVELYDMQQAARGIPNGIEVSNNYDLFDGFKEGVLKYLKCGRETD